MPYIKVWLHMVWATKQRLPLLAKPMRQIVFDHIKANALQKGIFIECIGGHIDHMHTLVSLGSDQTVSKIT